MPPFHQGHSVSWKLKAMLLSAVSLMIAGKTTLTQPGDGDADMDDDCDDDLKTMLPSVSWWQ